MKFAIVSEGKLRCFDNGVKVFEIDLSPRVATLLAKDLLAASLEMRDSTQTSRRCSLSR